MSQEIIQVWAGSMTPMNYCISLLEVDIEYERNSRYSHFQNWAFSRPPLLVPLGDVLKLWQHHDACPITSDQRIQDSIRLMVDHYEEDQPYEQWRAGKGNEQCAERAKEGAAEECEGANREGVTPTVPAESKE